MARSKRSITFDIFAQDKSAKTMRGVGSNAQKVGAQLKKVAVGVGIGLAAITAGMIRAGFEAVESLKRIETINAQTDAVIRSTAGAAGVTREQIVALADSLEAVTATEAEAIQEGANLLLTFKNIRNGSKQTEKIFDRTTAVLVDMSRAMGSDMKTAALQLGRALNDPIRGVTALTRSGVSFSDSQRDMIRSLQESGDLLGAQQVVLQALEEQFGGSGESYAGTLAGRIDTLNHNLGATAERVVQSLLPAFERLVDWGNSDLIPWLEGFASWFVDEGAPALEDFVGWIVKYKDELALAAVALGTLTAAQWVLNLSMAANPVGLVIAGLGALITLATLVALNFNEISKGIYSLAGSVVKGTKGILLGAAAGLQNFINAILLGLSRIFSVVNPILGLFGIGAVRIPVSVDFFTNLKNQLGALEANLGEAARVGAENYGPGTPGAPPPSAPGGRIAMAAGGIVRPVRGGVPVTMAEAGVPEAAIPLTEQNMRRFGFSGSGGGDVINVHVDGMLVGSMAQLGKVVTRAVEAARKTGDVRAARG